MHLRWMRTLESKWVKGGSVYDFYVFRYFSASCLDLCVLRHFNKGWQTEGRPFGRLSSEFYFNQIYI